MMTNMARRVLAGIGFGGLLLVATLSGCGADEAEVDDPANQQQGANDVNGDEPDLDRPKYTVIPGTGPKQVERTFEVLVPVSEEGTAEVYIDDATTGQGQSFWMTQGDKVEYGGWTFEAIFVGDTLFQFIATSPDGTVYPN
jgi:hypothetical protein